MSAQHTPTPWVNEGSGSIQGPTEWVGYFDNEASDNHDANVAFVVRAVNCHDELVAALKESTDCIGCELTQEEYDECMGKVQLAIAKATAP